MKFLRKLKCLFGTDDMLTEFLKSFPDKCPVCSMHRYGVSHGYERGLVKQHNNCIEANKKKTSEGAG